MKKNRRLNPNKRAFFVQPKVTRLVRCKFPNCGAEYTRESTFAHAAKYHPQAYSNYRIERQVAADFLRLLPKGYTER